MTIERLSYPKGVEVVTEDDAYLRAALDTKDFKEIEGSAIVEPAFLKRYGYKRQVSAAGRISKNESEKGAQFDATNVKPQKDGSILLNEVNQFFFVIGPGPKKTTRLYEVLRYVEKNPKNRRT